MEFIIHQTWSGYWGVWADEPDWNSCQPLDIFTTRQQAEAYEQELLLEYGD